MKKLLFFAFCFLVHGITHCFSQVLESAVYKWSISESLKPNADKKVLFSGSGKILALQQLTGTRVPGGGRLQFQESQSGDELFFIIKEGTVEIALNGNVQQLIKGSVIFLMPGDKLSIKNTHKDPVELYEMRMNAVEYNIQRGKVDGGSFVIHWNDMVYKPHDRGGVRQLFDRKTIFMNRFDIHITSLNPGISSHAPHTHLNEEIILMLDGEGEMLINGDSQHIRTGDAAWVGSMIPHNITNNGKRPAVYYAIQWN